MAQDVVLEVPMHCQHISIMSKSYQEVIMLIGINSELLLGSHDQVIGDVVLSVHQHGRHICIVCVSY